MQEKHLVCITSQQFTRVEAVDLCQQYGLQLLSVDSALELNCILSFFDGTPLGFIVSLLFFTFIFSVNRDNE